LLHRTPPQQDTSKKSNQAPEDARSAGHVLLPGPFHDMEDSQLGFEGARGRGGVWGCGDHELKVGLHAYGLPTLPLSHVIPVPSSNLFPSLFLSLFLSVFLSFTLPLCHCPSTFPLLSVFYYSYYELSSNPKPCILDPDPWNFQRRPLQDVSNNNNNNNNNIISKGPAILQKQGRRSAVSGGSASGHVHKTQGGGGGDASARVCAGNELTGGLRADGGAINGAPGPISGTGSFETLDSWLRVVKEEASASTSINAIAHTINGKEEASASASINVVARAVYGGTPPKMGGGGAGKVGGSDPRSRPSVKFSSPTSSNKEPSGGVGGGGGAAAEISMLKGLLKRSCEEISKLKGEVKEARRTSTQREAELGLANAALGEKNQQLM
jgi:hypothetical protein